MPPRRDFRRCTARRLLTTPSSTSRCVRTSLPGVRALFSSPFIFHMFGGQRAGSRKLIWGSAARWPGGFCFVLPKKNDFQIAPHVIEQKNTSTSGTFTSLVLLGVTLSLSLSPSVYVPSYPYLPKHSRRSHRAGCQRHREGQERQLRSPRRWGDGPPLFHSSDETQEKIQNNYDF